MTKLPELMTRADAEAVLLKSGWAIQTTMLPDDASILANRQKTWTTFEPIGVVAGQPVYSATAVRRSTGQPRKKRRRKKIEIDPWLS